MSSLNKVMIMGNVTRDVELRFTQGGTAVGEVGVAMNRRVKQGETWTDEATFVDVTVWGRTAELAKQYLSKGRSVFFEGRLQVDTWEDQQSGQKRSKLKVVAENMQFVGGVKNARGSGGQDSQEQPIKAAQQAPEPAANQGGQAAQAGGFDDGDDIPF